MSLHLHMGDGREWIALGNPLPPGRSGSVSDFAKDGDRTVIHFECNAGDDGARVYRTRPLVERLSPDRSVRVSAIDTATGLDLLADIPAGGRFEMPIRHRADAERRRVRFIHKADRRN